MQIPRIYVEDDLDLGEKTFFDKGLYHRIINVLRKRVGDSVIFFNGTGGCYSAELIELKQKAVTFNLLRFFDQEVESSLQVHFGQALVKTEKMGYAIQKAVELGVAEITPVYTKYSNNIKSKTIREKKVGHWNKISVHASEQSGRNKIVKINEPISFETWCDSVDGTKLILHPYAASSLSSLTVPKGTISFVSGPEGGFSEEEVSYAEKRGLISVKLGPRLVRTETAPVVLLSIAQYLWGDLK